MYMYMNACLSLGPLSVDSVNPSAGSDDSDIVAQEATEDLENTINEVHVYTTLQYTVCVQCIVVNKGYHTV